MIESVELKQGAPESADSSTRHDSTSVVSQAIDAFNRDGFTRIPGGLLSKDQFAHILAALDRLETQRTVDTQSSKLQNLNDAIYLDHSFLDLARNPDLVAMIETIFGCKVELQHSKMINKYPNQGAGSNVKWHQDSPFFPHTNDDLVALALHFDDESDDSGPLQFIAGSHKSGIFSHTDSNTGEFIYQINDPGFDLPAHEPIVVRCNAGDITLHHGNVIHASSPSQGRQRRVLYLEYRAIDALQLAGVIWKSTGFSPYAAPPAKRHARFRDGSRLELRSDGRLFDVSGKLAPDNKGGRSISE